MLVTNPDGQDITDFDESAINRELSEICAAFGKSDGSRRLLVYLVESQLRGKVPRETDVALDVFHRDASFDGAQDAVVRVAVRALRQKMEDYYRNAGQARPLRFDIPRGSYRVTVTRCEPTPIAIEKTPPMVASVPIAPTSPGEVDPQPHSAASGTARTGWIALVVAAAAAGIALGFGWRGREVASSQATVAAAPAVPATASPLWQPWLKGDRPIVIVLGDLLLFPNPQAAPGRVQLIRDARINTREQLRDFLGGTVERSQSGPGTQVATTLVPMSVAYGLVDLLPIVTATGRPFEVRVFDELQVEKLRTHDVIYIGPLVAIGPLGDALFRNSNYEFDIDEESRFLLNRKTGQKFRPSRGRQENASDFGLFASFRGPEGNRVIVLASAGSDLGLVPLLRGVTSEEGLNTLSGLLSRDSTQPLPEEFEAVMSVSGFYRTDLGAQFIEAGARP